MATAAARVDADDEVPHLSDALHAALLSDASEVSAIQPNTARLSAKGAVKDVCILDVTVAIDGHELLSSTSLRLLQGHRYGLVGKNGCGKSTLLRRIAGGQIAGFPTHLRCHLVTQEVEGSERTALQEVLDSDIERTALLAEAARLSASEAEDSEALVAVYDRLAAIDSDGAEARAASALDELGFSKAAQGRATRALSGGWRMRVALAAAVFLQPDVLLLDEPTNHLDLHGVLWLTAFLLSLDSTVLLVSHDSAFLAAVTTDIVHFHQHALVYYAGDFDAFLEARSNQLTNLSRQQSALDAKREHIQKSIDKMKAQARSKGHPEQRLGLVASRHKKLGRMGLEKTADGKKFNAQRHGRRAGSANDAPITTDRRRHAISQIEPPDRDFKFQFPEPDFDKVGQGAALLSAVDVAFGYGVGEQQMRALRTQVREWKEAVDEAALAGVMAPPAPPTPPESRLLFANVDLTVRAGDIIGIIGANGLGKSSLLKVLSGQLEPSFGEVRVGADARVAYFSQHLVEQLDVRRTPLAHLLALMPALAASPNSEQQARAVLGRFGLGGSLALKPIGVLSGGQKARLTFACITAAEPHVLVLDEPTNHLDLVTNGALVDAVRDFSGAVLVVSHDQALLECCTQLHLIDVRKATAPVHLNPNQLKARAERLQKEREKERLKSRAAKAASSRPPPASSTQPLPLPSRCTFSRLSESFDDYRARIADEKVDD